MYALQFRKLSLGYDHQPAIHQLHAEITTGSLTAIVGPNGAGKSTLLKGVMGMLTPMEGSLAFGSLAEKTLHICHNNQTSTVRFPLQLLKLSLWGCGKKLVPSVGLTKQIKFV